MAKSKSAGDKKRSGVASKSSKDKHSVANKKKNSRKAAVANRRASAVTRVPRSVTPPPLIIELARIFCVGALKPRRDWNLQPHVQQRVQALVEANPLSHFYLYMSTEGLANPNNSVDEVPIVVAVQCDCAPTTFVVETTVQSAKEDFISFETLGMRWKQVHPQVSILQCEAPINGFRLEKLILYSELPSQVDAEQPDPVETVSVKWNGTDVTWMGDGESMQECVEEELGEDASDEEKALVQTLLEEERLRETTHRQLLVDEKKARFRGMIEANDMSEAALESRRVFKVYPQDSRLEPKMTAFGVTGFRKNILVNRYIGNAEQFF